MTDLSELSQIEVGGPGLYTPFQSVMGHGTPPEGWTLGDMALQLRQTSKGLMAGDSLLIKLPEAGPASPSLTQELSCPSPCLEC